MRHQLPFGVSGANDGVGSNLRVPPTSDPRHF